MKTIRNTKLFNELIIDAQWEYLFSGWTLKDNNIPVLFGGLDSIEVKAKGVYFHDIGINGKDNSFVIRPEIR